MRLAEDNDVVRALAPDRSDQPFGKTSLPARGWCNWLISDAHGAQSTCDDGAINAIPVSDHVARSPVPRKCLRYLACNPFCRGIPCDVDPDQISAVKSDVSKPMVGTTNKSIAAMSGAWLRRKVSHPWPGGPRRGTMYMG